MKRELDCADISPVLQDVSPVLQYDSVSLETLYWRAHYALFTKCDGDSHQAVLIRKSGSTKLYHYDEYAYGRRLDTCGDIQQ